MTINKKLVNAHYYIDKKYYEAVRKLAFLQRKSQSKVISEMIEEFIINSKLK